MAMKLEYVKTAKYEKDNACPHNDACRCTRKNCSRCGWNPTVAKMRLAKLQGTKTEG